MNTNSLQQHVKKPTRRNNILDLVLKIPNLSIMEQNRGKFSYLINLLDFFGEVNCIYDRTKAVGLVYPDFQQAFDKVRHERLMVKVEAHGIRGNYSRWTRTDSLVALYVW
ncbi:hypothetical protein FHG87_009186 [Trinorchestia longiramus]|nr:hypothetical protein FHG87_009186 [Trinorchestia longiramus]